MKPLAYYNEIDPFAAQWLRNLIAAGRIAPGIVDERSIEDVTPNDLHGFKQVHLFAGISVWSLALRCAGWPDDRPVWTASCPCQPFSPAGKGKGFADERHLWPSAHWLAGQCRPVVVLGEQSSSKDANDWIDLVQTDMESLGYAFGAVAFPAAGIGAPHIRERAYWVAHANSECGKGGGHEWPSRGNESANSSAASGLAHANYQQQPITLPAGSFEHVPPEWNQNPEAFAGCGSDCGPGPVNGFWRDADWLLCRDGKWRPAKPGLELLVNGVAGRVGKLRASGNGLNLQAATAFINSVMSAGL